MAGKDYANPKLALERKKNRSASNTPRRPAPVKPPRPVTPPVVPPPALVPVPCVDGFDISAYCGPADFEQIRDVPWLRFCYFRYSIGTTKDARVDQYMAGATSIGVPFGLYHLFRPSRDWRKQADRFFPAARDAKLPAWADFEITEGVLKTPLESMIYKFLQYGLEHYGVWSTIYTNCGFWDSCMPLTNFAKMHPLAVASWSQTAKFPSIPRDWQTRQQTPAQLAARGWEAWQWWNKLRIPGVGASVDAIRIPVSTFAELVG
jgi:GH25 family lysozyme M1 (1,4-beta-N-acetylmuramidase)